MVLLKVYIFENKKTIKKAAYLLLTIHSRYAVILITNCSIDKADR